MQESLSPASQRRVNRGGRPFSTPILTYIGWGPIIEDEFDRLRAAEVQVVAEAEGGALAPGRIAVFSFNDMSRLFRLQLPVELTLPLKTQRKRGEIMPLDIKFSRMTFTRLYGLFNGKAAKEIEFVSRFRAALNDARWSDAIKLTFEPIKKGFEDTVFYRAFLDTSAQMASGCCLVFASGAGEDLLRLTDDDVEAINVGELNRLNRIAAKHRVHVGWLLALFVALFRRKHSAQLRSELRKGGIAPLEVAVWSVVPDYELSAAWAMYADLRDGKSLNPSKPGPKPRKKNTRADPESSEAKPEAISQIPVTPPADAPPQEQPVIPVEQSVAAPPALVDQESSVAGPEDVIRGLVARARNVARKS